jgi:hypothetical protein
VQPPGFEGVDKAGAALQPPGTGQGDQTPGVASPSPSAAYLSASLDPNTASLDGWKQPTATLSSCSERSRRPE